MAEQGGNEILEQALHYAIEWGWPVIPLYGIENGRCTCGKNCASPGKHPACPNGLRDATTDPEKIETWFGNGKIYNIGILTGPESNLAVIDLDISKGAELESLGAQLPDTVEVVTGGGRHYYFTYPKNSELKNSANRLAPFVDVRGAGGYVVAPPSTHISGNKYRFGLWESLAEFPASLLQKLTNQNLPATLPAQNGSHGPNNSTGLIIPPAINENPENVLSGARNVTLASMAGKLRHYGFGQQAIEAALLAENERICRPPLDVIEVRRIAQSIAQNYAPATNLITPGAAPDDYENTLKVFLFGELLEQEFEQKEILGFHIGKRDIGILQAATNAGKTTLLRNIALCMAAGREFDPFFEGIRPVRIGYFDFENDPPDVQRDMKKMFEVFTDREKELIRKNLIVIPKGLMNSELFQFNRHEAWTENLLRQNKIEYIFVDNVSAAYDLMDENSNAEVTKKVIKPLLKMAYKCNAAFLFAHHYGKSGKNELEHLGVHAGRGASALQALSRTVINMFGNVAEGEQVTVECAKRKTDGGQNYRRVFELREDRWFYATTIAPPVKKKDPYLQIKEFICARAFPETITTAGIIENFQEEISVRTIKNIIKELYQDGWIERPKHGEYCGKTAPKTWGETG